MLIQLMTAELSCIAKRKCPGSIRWNGMIVMMQEGERCILLGYRELLVLIYLS